jgi:hypothetical protein
VEYTRRGFSSLWDITMNSPANQVFSSAVSHTAGVFFSCILHRKRIFSIVSHSTEGSGTLWDKAETKNTMKNDPLPIYGEN